MQTYNINGTALAGEERGKGESLLLVHGAVGDFRTWESVVSAFATRYRVITYSRRWHHPNPAPVNGAPYTPDGHTADLIALVAACGGGPIRLLGHSYGAAICAVLAMERPELVRCLVLAEPSLFGMALSNPLGAVALAQTAAATLHVVPLLRKGERERALREFLYSVIGKEGYARLSERVLQVMSDNVHTLEPMLNGMSSGLSFTGKQAARINAPTLLVQGEHTTTLFRTTMKALAHTVPNAQRAVIPNVGHGLHLEDPDAFSRVALEFFARH
jgi:pimeloyl-ACP methyl ester carboxylesterase